VNRAMPAPTESLLTGEIVEWDRQKGYGFLQVGKQRVFLHRRDFAEHHKKPAVGDAIHFMMGKDAKGRTCATNARHVNDGGRITTLNVLVTVGLLGLPVMAIQRLHLDWRWVVVYGLAMNALTYWAYARDKRRAEEGE
jgi:cold shock CspA family protein